jgi:glutamate 5-kinase
MTDASANKGNNTRESIVTSAGRLVIKLGTTVVMGDEGGGARGQIASFVEAIADLKQAGREVLLVSSGAVGLGAERLGATQRGRSLPLKQACAAVGQGRLMALYSDALDRFGITTAQILVTEEDFSNRRRYLNLRSTISKLLELGVLPIINENDTVSTAEIEPLDGQSFQRVNFGDNDKLSALVASKIGADLLLLLTDVDGLYSSNPDSDDARLISVVEEITTDIEALGQAGSSTSGLGRGGMKTKIEAARIATQSGCAVIIANGKLPAVIQRVCAGEELGTLFLPRAGLPEKRRWIAFATTVKAALKVNEGAERALLDGKASLLAAGVTEVRGSFERGDVVSILDVQEREFARGIINYSSVEVRKLSGQRSEKIDELIENRNYDALITRDNISFLG